MIDDSWLRENASIVQLPDGSEIYQHKQGQKISSDNEVFNDILYKRFSSDNALPKRVLELGLGNGINSIMLKKKFPQWNITGVEIDSEQAKLAEYNCDLQAINIQIKEGDLRNLQSDEKYDLIIANPPYQKVGSGRQSPYLRTNLAKFELTCRMEDVFIALKKNLSINGEAWLLYAQEREADLIKNIDEGIFNKILMIRKNKIVIVGLKYVAS